MQHATYYIEHSPDPLKNTLKNAGPVYITRSINGENRKVLILPAARQQTWFQFYAFDPYFSKRLKSRIQRQLREYEARG